jgi:hypothetical protein
MFHISRNTSQLPLSRIRFLLPADIIVVQALPEPFLGYFGIAEAKHAKIALNYERHTTDPDS